MGRPIIRGWADACWFCAQSVAVVAVFASLLYALPVLMALAAGAIR